MTLGGTIGLVAAWWLSNSIRTFLFDARPHDPLVYVGAAVVLATSGVIAALIPAVRASRVDPIVALRTE
jgi:putative ABC transport system permease protein